MSERHEWAEDDRSRYGIYLQHPRTSGPYCTTSKEGIGTTLVALRESGELQPGDKFGVLDGFGELGWLIDPFVGGMTWTRP